jgi:DnaJ-class molecular chaperone
VTLEEALRVIGLDALGQAFAEALRKAHPDHGGDPATAEETIKQVKQARDVIKATLTTPERMRGPPCKNCGGRGSIPSTFGATSCQACGGTGEQKW